MAETPKPLLNPGPKTRFIQNRGAVESFNNVIQLPAVRQALDAALLQYEDTVINTSQKDMNGAVAGYFRMLGAKELVDTLIMIGVSVPPPPQRTTENLDHRA